MGYSTRQTHYYLFSKTCRKIRISILSAGADTHDEWMPNHLVRKCIVKAPNDSVYKIAMGDDSLC